MEITRRKEPDVLVLEVRGRLDASWCENLRAELSSVIRAGEHHIDLDLSGLEYLSSAGLRVLFLTMKDLDAIKGRLGLRNPSPTARKILDLSGLGGLFTAAAPGKTPVSEGRRVSTGEVDLEIFEMAAGGCLEVGTLGIPGNLDPGLGGKTTLDCTCMGLGHGAFAEEAGSAREHLGELIAVAGCGAVQSAKGGGRPDYLITECGLVPEVWMAAGLSAHGDFSLAGRFEATGERKTAGLSDLCHVFSSLLQDRPLGFVVVAETAGLVGAALCGLPGEGLRFQFPEIREWLGFTSERSFRDTTCLLAGFLAASPSPIDPWLRPVGNGQTSHPAAHVHAAVFPYRPIQKGLLDLKTTVSGLFESQALQAVLHLVNDNRQPGGSGESEFRRGAFWLGPLAFSSFGS